MADTGPELNEEHDIADGVFKDLLRTSRVCETEKKVFNFVEIQDFAALCGVMDILPDEQPELWEKVKVLEEVWNDTRPQKKRAPRGKKR